MSAEPPAPVTSDPDTGGFFAAAAQGKLAVRQCGDCRAFIHLPQQACSHCGSLNSRWTTVQPGGRVYSWTVVERQFSAAFPVPYTIVIVELNDAPGVRLIGHLPGQPRLTAGTALRADFEQRGDAALPRWRLAEPGHH